MTIAWLLRGVSELKSVLIKKKKLLILNRLHNWLLPLKGSYNLHAWIYDHVAHKWQQLDAPILGTKHYL